MKFLYNNGEHKLSVITDDKQVKIDMGALRSVGTDMWNRLGFKFIFINGVEIFVPREEVVFE